MLIIGNIMIGWFHLCVCMCYNFKFKLNIQDRVNMLLNNVELLWNLLFLLYTQVNERLEQIMIIKYNS